MIGDHELAEIANRHLALAKQRDSLLAMLERLEWCAGMNDCPTCGMKKQHDPDCELAALLAVARGGR